MITFESKGSFQRTESFLQKLTTGEIYKSLRAYGEKGRTALQDATPTRTGRAASSWNFNVIKKGNNWELVWSNTDREDGFPVVIMLQYGHGTGTGGYIRGKDFINPAIQPVFDEIAESVWREVRRT